ncbi:MAG: hypothetical protein FD180_2359 [Planctomycetota bacterium]|nr:MAG: hypothetical protein FD180_2359 [Planctomycetota bacterium]
MTRCVKFLAAALLVAGCSSFEKKPPPEPPEAPPEETEPPPEPEPPPAEPVEPSKPPVEPVKPPDPEPAKPPAPPRQELPGSWTSTTASGPGSASVRRVDMEFSADGAWCGSMLVEVDGKKRFESLDGTWSLSESKATVKLGDGRERAWAVSWDGATLILRDGDAELRLRRVD